MGLFSVKKEDFLGVDIGTSSIKIVQLANDNNKARLVTYGMAEVNFDILRNKNQENVNLMISSLKNLLVKSRVSSKNCSAALPTFSVFSSVISLPVMNKIDLDSAVKWEAKKFIPFPIEDMILDWKIIDNGDISISGVKKSNTMVNEDIIKTKSKFNRVLLTAAPKNLVAIYVDVFKKVGLNLCSLEVESFAMARALMDTNSNSTMIVDIGSITTDVCVVENDLPVLNRSIEVGGRIITQSIAKSLNINFERAEQFKQDFGLVASSEESSNIPKTIEETLSPMINEIKYVFDLYKRQGKGNVDKVILSGGSAYLPNLVDYLSKILNTSVYIGDSWHKVMYPKELKPILDEIGPRFSVAIGLGLRNII